ncbi:beta strand repeat-containing protein [Spirosoma litoris]
MVQVYSSFMALPSYLKRVWLCILFCLLGQLVHIPAANATHFRYGNLSWRQLPSDATGRTIEFKLTMGFRLSYSNFSPTPTVGSTVSNANANGSAAFTYGDGTTTTAFNFTVTSVNTADDYFYAEAILTKAYSTTGNFTAFIEASARLSTLQNNGDGRYRINSLVNVGAANANLPPASTLPPIVNLPFNQSAATFTVPATDPDGNPLTFSLATAADLGATSYTFTQPTNFSISSSGVATFDTRSPKAVGQLYNAIIKISDGKSFVIVDFIIKIVAASDPPVFVYGGITPANNSTIQTYVGCPINFNVRATDTDPTSNTITLQGVGLPSGATFSPVTGSNTVTSAFSFNPTTEGTSVTSFYAQDNIGNQAITSVTFRVLQPLLTANASLVCVGSTISLTATPGTSASGVTNYTFRGPNGIIGSTSTTNTATVSGLAAGVYNFSVTTTNSLNSNTACTSTAVTSVTVDAPPTVTLTNSGTLTCTVTSVTLTATSSTAPTSYAFTGPGLSQTGSTSTAVVTQPGTYTVLVTTPSGCTAVATTTVVSNTATPATPTVSLIQPSCTLATGTITVTAPTGTGLTYSINGTTYTNTTGVFTGVAAGTYTVTVRNTNSGCTSSATSVTITAQPATPAAPTVNVTQPTCTQPTGTITITAPTGTGLTYSIDGVNYVSSTTFSGVAPGTYSVTVRNSSGCTSSATTATVNGALLASAAPTASVTSQPNCLTATGTITITAPTGLGFSYSIDGSTYTNTTGVFTGVAPGVYAVTDRNGLGCISTATSVTVNAQPSTPAAPTVSVTAQPNCLTSTGTITITAPIGTGLTYSINGTTYTNTTGVFTGVVAGTYAVTVRNSSGCTSAATSVTVNAQPPTPVLTLNSVSICAGSSTTLSVGGCTGGTLLWSTGDNTTSIVVAPVVTTTYSATCTNTSGCSASVSATVTIRPTPTFTSIPTVTAATCNGVTATNSAHIDFTTLQNTERADISLGATYSGPAYGAASNKIVTSSAVSFSSLPNPASSQTYTIRLFSGSGSCFVDVGARLDPVNCQCPSPSCVIVTIAP